MSLSPFTITLIVIAVVLLISLIVLYFAGRRLQKRQDEQNAAIEKTAQTVSMLIIDKKKMRLKNAGLPPEVEKQAPFYSKLSKLPIVKAKVGPRMMTFVCDPTLYDMVPVKKEVKAQVSGIYISSVKGLHGKIEIEPKKKSLWKRITGQ